MTLRYLLHWVDIRGTTLLRKTAAIGRRMSFDAARYAAEIDELWDRVVQEANRQPGLVVYTISIWTDPDARVSAVSLDTAEHSAAHIAYWNEWARVERERLTAAGDHHRMARLLERRCERNTDPADFRYRYLAECANRSFPHFWEEITDGRCWDLLEPALLAARDRCRQRAGGLRLHPDAAIGVNGRRDWFEHVVVVSGAG